MSMTEPGKGRLAAIKLGFIGVGSMGGAIIKGLLAGGFVPRETPTDDDPDPARQAQMDELGVAAALDNAEVMHAPVVVLGAQASGAARGSEWRQRIRPALAPDHFHRRRGPPGGSGRGLPPLPGDPGSCPTPPALVGAGMAALAPGHGVTPEDLALALELFEAVGQAVVVEERLMDAVTGLSGSGPAFVAVFMEARAGRRGVNGAAPRPGPHPGHPDGPGHGPPLP